jgi:hypothetical protein
MRAAIEKKPAKFVEFGWNWYGNQRSIGASVSKLFPTTPTLLKNWFRESQ